MGGGGLSRLRLGLLAALLALASGLSAPAFANDKDAALIMDAQTGKILYSRAGDESRFPASLTKMMTLYLLFERLAQGKLTMDDEFRVSKYAASQDPAKLGLRPKSRIAVQDAIYALIVRSANDVAVVVAEGIGGTEAKFARLMTQKARALGMRSTHFYNASGLPNPLQRTTARDMAILGRALMRDFPQYFHFFEAKSFSFAGKFYTTHNRLLNDFEGAQGIKTGYTRASGFNLVSSVQRNGKRIIGVVLGGRTALERDAEMRILLNNMFDKIEDKPTLVAAYVTPRAGENVAIVTQPRRKPGVVGPDEDDGGDEIADVIVATAPEAVEATVAASVPIPKPSPAARAALRTNIDPGPKPAFIAEAPRTVRVEDGAIVTASLTGVPEDAGEGDIEDVSKPVPGGPTAWGIQVGAYRDRAAAEQQVRMLASAASAIIGEAEAVVTPFRSKDNVLYRARFGPFEPAEARSACRKLEERGLSCLAVVDNDWPVDAAP